MSFLEIVYTIRRCHSTIGYAKRDSQFYGMPLQTDGDGKTDILELRPSTGVWYMLQPTLGSGGLQWGIATDKPISAAFSP